jgi:hypothetical protein
VANARWKLKPWLALSGQLGLGGAGLRLPVLLEIDAHPDALLLTYGQRWFRSFGLSVGAGAEVRLGERLGLRVEGQLVPLVFEWPAQLRDPLTTSGQLRTGAASNGRIVDVSAAVSFDVLRTRTVALAAVLDAGFEWRGVQASAQASWPVSLGFWALPLRADAGPAPCAAGGRVDPRGGARSASHAPRDGARR